MPRYLPSPISAICGGLLFGLLIAFGTVAMIAVPPLMDLFQSSPRLAMLGFLLLATSPGIAIAVAHHFGASTLESIEKVTVSKKKGPLPDLESWAAGAHGWLVLIGTSILARLVMLVMNPPKPDPDAFSVMNVVETVHVQNVASGQTIIWIAIATLFFELQRRSRATA